MTIFDDAGVVEILKTNVEWYAQLRTGGAHETEPFVGGAVVRCCAAHERKSVLAAHTANSPTRVEHRFGIVSANKVFDIGRVRLVVAGVLVSLDMKDAHELTLLG